MKYLILLASLTLTPGLCLAEGSLKYLDPDTLLDGAIQQKLQNLSPTEKLTILATMERFQDKESRCSDCEQKALQVIENVGLSLDEINEHATVVRDLLQRDLEKNGCGDVSCKELSRRVEGLRTNGTIQLSEEQTAMITELARKLSQQNSLENIIEIATEVKNVLASRLAGVKDTGQAAKIIEDTLKERFPDITTSRSAKE